MTFNTTPHQHTTDDKDQTENLARPDDNKHSCCQCGFMTKDDKVMRRQRDDEETKRLHQLHPTVAPRLFLQHLELCVGSQQHRKRCSTMAPFHRCTRHTPHRTGSAAPPWRRSNDGTRQHWFVETLPRGISSSKQTTRQLAPPTPTIPPTMRALKASVSTKLLRSHWQ